MSSPVAGRTATVTILPGSLSASSCNGHRGLAKADNIAHLHSHILFCVWSFALAKAMVAASGSCACHTAASVPISPTLGRNAALAVIALAAVHLPAQQLIHAYAHS